MTLERTTIPAPLGKFQRYLVQKLEPMGFIILDVVHWDEEGRVGHAVIHPRPEYTLEDCKALVQWLNHRDKVFNAADRLATACSNYYDRTGKFPIRIVMHPRFHCDVARTIPGEAVQDVMRYNEPTFYGVPIKLDRTCVSDYSLIAPVELAHL